MTEDEARTWLDQNFNVSRETWEKLEAFITFLKVEAARQNLISASTLDHIWARHIVDSAQLLMLAPSEPGQWIDLGSGAGFPGIVVAILAKEMKPDLHVTLVESDLRKATFLRQAAQSLALPVAVRSNRIESLDPLNADVLSARALAPLSDLLAYADRHLAAGGVAIFPKGARYAEELAAAQENWAFDADTQQSHSDADAAILVIRNIHRHD